jgi:hypothetical protein
LSEPATDNANPVRHRRWPWLVTLIVIACVSFGSYYRHGINFRDEGGTLTLLGQRLLDGEVPFRDVELGYNIGWFIPIVGLFKITGVNFVALRVFCFAMSTLAAVLGFLTVEKAARHARRDRLALPLAFAAGLMLIAVPGMTFKNYNPLAAVANTWCLLGFVLSRSTREVWWRALVGGVVLGATWLVRIDLGTLFSLLWLGTLLAGVCARDFRIRTAAAALTLIVIGVAAVHAPVLYDAKVRGYDAQFTGRYPSEWKRMFSKLPLLAGATSAAKPAGADAAKGPANPPPPAAKPGVWKHDTLKRTTWNDVQSASAKNRNKVLCLLLLTYLPILALLPLVAWAVARWFRALSRGDTRTPLAVLVLIGGSLSMFAQFFFWRPDSPHLSEFGPGYWTALFGVLALLGLGAGWRAPGRWFAVFLTLHAGVWLWRMVPDRWTGTIAARFDRDSLFEGENGVRIYETDRTARWMNDALRLIRENSTEQDYLVAYPYHPSFNVLANRRTYERNVYIDNAEAKPGWNAAAVRRIEEHRPKIIIISDWDVNGTEASRFRNWAAPVLAHIHAHYDLRGTFDEKEKFEVYVRRD